MDAKYNNRKFKKHPQENSNILSNLFYCWTMPLFRKGLQKELSEEDIYQILHRHDSSKLGDKLQKAWNEQLKQNVKPSLWKAIWKLFKWEILSNIVLYFIRELIIGMIRPFALGKLLGYYSINESGVTKNDAYMYASFIIISSFLDNLMGQFYTMQYMQLGLTVRVAGSSLLYRKSLKLSKKALSETTAGQIINLLSNDMQHITAMWGAFNPLWASPLKAGLILYLLYLLCGPTALVGIVFIVTLTPLQLFMSKKSANYRMKIALKTDERIRYMTEIISGIQVIKMYTWEQSFIKLIDLIRRKEMSLIKISKYLNAVTVSFYFFVNKTAIFLCILTYVLTGNNPDAQYVFVVSSFYALLMISISAHLPESVSQIIKANVSIKRLEKFLKLDEIQSQKILTNSGGLKVNGATAKWSQELSDNTLNNVDFEASSGQVVAIIGSIGSGKSSLLQLCLSEISLTKGYIEVGGKISYANQEPWVFAGTIKQNILFGQPMNEDKYREVIEVCGLGRDIAQFPFGDNTTVGDRGILLSGGQKARISLARAVYKDADIYLLDDPLSAVDASVGKQIFNNCIVKYLKCKCVVLVTHQVQYLGSVNKIYLMKNGAIAACGNYQDLRSSGEDFTKLLSQTEKCEDEEISTSTVTECFDKKESKEEENEEEKKEGKVSKKVYLAYIRSGSTFVSAFLMALFFICTEVLSTGSEYYVAFWVNWEQKKMENNITVDDNSTTHLERLIFTNENYIYVYTGIIVALIIVSIMSSLTFIRNCMIASVHLHDKMFTSVINSTMKFFYCNSSGRILNRFSKDIGSIDEVLPSFLMAVIQLILSGVWSILLICLVNTWTLIPTVIIFLIMYSMNQVFLKSSRSIQRMESTNRSPIFAHLSESMKGLSTIRAYNASEILQKEFDNYQNIHSSIRYMFIGANRAFGTWLDLVCVMYVSIITIIALIQETYGGSVGFILTKGTVLTGLLQWGVRMWSSLENQMVSVERVTEYFEIDQENYKKITEPPTVWPSYGRIEFQSVFMQYNANDPYVLKNLKLTIKSKEKIGIVGRTGAGKSSLIAILFRLVDFEGNILIDDINTREVALSDLRSKISIIPQEPTLFSGTVRKNLDPFDQYTDDQIWKVLEEVKLKEFVAKLASGIQSNLSEGGSNFSVGQKQLICLARALLKKNKILIMDEATANVDPQTDELLQQTIRKNFKDCSVLTIAHRLHTIMDSDKVLVMKDGCAVEFDHPHLLLQTKGVFHDLVMETGSRMSENLMRISQKNYENNK